MAHWAYINIKYDGTGYNGNFKRDIGEHSHPKQQDFFRAAVAFVLNGINEQLRAKEEDEIAQPDLTIGQLHVESPDPGQTYKEI